MKFELGAIHGLSRHVAVFPLIIPKKKQKGKETEVKRLPNIPTILIPSVRVGVQYLLYLSSHGALEKWLYSVFSSVKWG